MVSFFALNSGLSLLNRWALGFHGFKMPLAMTALHMLFGAFSLSPIMLLKASYRDAHREILRRNGRALFAMGIINALQIAANNASMETIDVRRSIGARSCSSRSIFFAVSMFSTGRVDIRFA